jgi:ferric-dicitrate binding protein FerR (iron transport regulator)
MALASGSSDSAATVAKPVPDWRRHAAGITALAASLVLGVMIGQNANVAPAMSDIASAVGIASLGDGSQIASTDESYIGIDEDML